MLKKISPLLIITFLLGFCFEVYSQKQSAKKLVIEGELKNLPDETPFIYGIFSGLKNDSAKVINGKYKFVVVATNTILVTLYSKHYYHPDAYKNRNMFTFLSEPSRVKISSKDSFSNAKISGSIAYREYLKLEEIAEPYTLKLSPLLKQLSKEKEANNKEEQVKLQKEIDSLRYLRRLEYLRYIKQNPHSPAKALAIANFAYSMKETEVAKVTELYNTLPEYEQQGSFGKEIKAKLKNFEIKINTKAPLFAMKDTSAQLISLESFKGKYVLLDFWASWCGPCRKESPLLVKFYNQYKERDFTIVSVSLDKEGDRKKWLDAIEKDKMIWNNLSDLKGRDNEVAKLYRVSAIPRNFFISPDGTIMAVDVHGAELEKLLAETIK